MTQQKEANKRSTKVIGEIGPNGFRSFSTDSSSEKKSAFTSEDKATPLKTKRTKDSDKKTTSKKEYDLESDFLFHHLLTLACWGIYKIILPILMVKELFAFNFIKVIFLGGVCFLVWAITFALRTFGSMGPTLLRIVFFAIAGYHSWMCLSMFKTQILLMVNQLSLPVNHQELGIRVIVTMTEIAIFLIISNYYDKRKEFFH